MVKVKCKYCNATGYKFCTHGSSSKKKYIQHSKKCNSPIEKEKRRREDRLK